MGCRRAQAKDDFGLTVSLIAPWYYPLRRAERGRQNLRQNPVRELLYICRGEPSLAIARVASSRMRGNRQSRLVPETWYEAALPVLSNAYR